MRSKYLKIGNYLLALLGGFTTILTGKAAERKSSWELSFLL
jgi:hypothetical protein